MDGWVGGQAVTAKVKIKLTLNRNQKCGIAFNWRQLNNTYTQRLMNCVATKSANNNESTLELNQPDFYIHCNSLTQYNLFHTFNAYRKRWRVKRFQWPTEQNRIIAKKKKKCKSSHTFSRSICVTCKRIMRSYIFYLIIFILYTFQQTVSLNQIGHFMWFSTSYFNIFKLFLKSLDGHVSGALFFDWIFFHLFMSVVTSIWHSIICHFSWINKNIIIMRSMISSDGWQWKEWIIIIKKDVKRNKLIAISKYLNRSKSMVWAKVMMMKRCDTMEWIYFHKTGI